MIASFSTLSGLVYIQLGPKRNISKTLEFDEHTVVEVDEQGGLVAVELITPSHSTLKRIAKKYQRWELSRINLGSLRKVFD